MPPGSACNNCMAGAGLSSGVGMRPDSDVYAWMGALTRRLSVYPTLQLKLLTNLSFVSCKVYQFNVGKLLSPSRKRLGLDTIR